MLERDSGPLGGTVRVWAPGSGRARMRPAPARGELGRQCCCLSVCLQCGVSPVPLLAYVLFFLKTLGDKCFYDFLCFLLGDGFSLTPRCSFSLFSDAVSLSSS